MTGDVRITMGEGPTDFSVELDGHEVRGMCSVEFRLSACDMPVVTIEIEPAAFTYEGPTPVLFKREPKWSLRERLSNWWSYRQWTREFRA